MTDAAAPIFIFGALRSGTTVFRLMLDAHEAIYNPGEFDFLFRFLDKGADGVWRYDKDAMTLDRVFNVQGMQIPEGMDGAELFHDFLRQIRAKGDGVFTVNLHAGVDKLVEIMPDARVIHMLRDPRDVARSSLGMGWAATLYHGVEHWIGTERAWARAEPKLPPENRMELRYESLFRDIETELRRVCAFIGVPFAEAMLRYHENSTYGPPDPKLVEQWRTKVSPRDLQLVEGRVGPLLASCGYAPSGQVPAAPGALEALGLSVRNIWGRWRFSARRYGTFLAAADRVTRRLGLAGPHRAVRMRMNEIQQRAIK